MPFKTRHWFQTLKLNSPNQQSICKNVKLFTVWKVFLNMSQKQFLPNSKLNNIRLKRMCKLYQQNSVSCPQLIQKYETAFYNLKKYLRRWRIEKKFNLQLKNIFCLYELQWNFIKNKKLCEHVCKTRPVVDHN